MTHPTSPIELALSQTFDDLVLSRGEQQALEQLLADYKQSPEQLSFARNRAFDLVTEHLRRAPHEYSAALKWLKRVIRALDAVRGDDAVVETTAHFSPGKSCLNKILSLLENARRSVRICVFTISDDRLSEEIFRAHKRGIDVKIITDNDKAYDQGSDVLTLAQKGVAVKIDTSPNHMHHKFSIFDNKTLANGSFNWTRSATRYNEENVMVTNDPRAIAPFIELFDGLWKKFETV